MLLCFSVCHINKHKHRVNKHGIVKNVAGFFVTYTKEKDQDGIAKDMPMFMPEEEEAWYRKTMIYILCL